MEEARTQAEERARERRELKKRRKEAELVEARIDPHYIDCQAYLTIEYVTHSFAADVTNRSQKSLGFVTIEIVTHTQGNQGNVVLDRIRQQFKVTIPPGGTQRVVHGQLRTPYADDARRRGENVAFTARVVEASTRDLRPLYRFLGQVPP